MIVRANLVLAAFLHTSIAAYLHGEARETPRPDTQNVIGIGASLVRTWLFDAGRTSGVRKPPTRFDIGVSGPEKAIGQLLDGTVDFACIDVSTIDYLKDRPAEMQARLQWIPLGASCLGFAYQLKGLEGPLILNADAIIGIYEGRITRWNDPALQRLNRGLLPDKPIRLIVPTFASGITRVLTSFLSNHSNDWKTQFGVGSLVKWPVGEGVKTGGLPTVIREQDGSIGCVGIRIDDKEALPNALLQTSDGELVGPTSGAIEKTVSAAIGKGNRRVDPTTLPVKGGYPLVSIASIVVRQDSSKAAAVRALAKWFLDGADKGAEPLGCIRLPPESKKVVVESAGLSD